MDAKSAFDRQCPMFHWTLCAILFVGLTCGVWLQPVAAQDATAVQVKLSNAQLLTETQRRTFEYFWSGAEEHSGWARERIHLDEPEVDATLVTSGGTGFGLMAILVGVERNFVEREAAVERLEKIFEFAERADRFHGMWPHWLHGDTGKVQPFSPDDDGADLVESSFFAQGLICVRQYFANGNEA